MIDYVKDNYNEIGLIVLAGYGLLSAIVRVIPTKNGDEIVGKLGKLLHAIFEGTRRIKK